MNALDAGTPPDAPQPDAGPRNALQGPVQGGPQQAPQRPAPSHEQTVAAEVHLLFTCDNRVSFNSLKLSGPLVRSWCNANQPGEDQYLQQDAHQQGHCKLLATGYVCRGGQHRVLLSYAGHGIEHLSELK